MKKLVLLMAMMLFATSMAYAECSCKGGKGKMSEESVEKKVAKMTKRLSLTEDQAGQVKALMTICSCCGNN